MYLYNLTLQRATGITCAVHGNFSGAKLQEVIVARGKILELLRHDPNTGKIYPVLTQETFGVIRSLIPFRLTGGNKDYVVVGSDSGRIIILEYLAQKNTFEKVHQETFGKSGCRRIVPGQFLAVDPKGRAVMIGAVEKQKLVYILNRDAQARLTISSPLEAHKANTLVYHMVGVDVGFENPTFACLEIDYEECDLDPTGEAGDKVQQLLTYYELDLGLNHVVRKYSEQLEEHANFLISVPGGSDGPSGVMICSENYVTYKNLGDQPDIRCPIPRRRNDLDDPERGMLFVCSATHKTKSMFFFLAQTEQGDIFKITLETDEDMVTEIHLKYFDTIPVASSICVLKSGFLFSASEFGNQPGTYGELSPYAPKGYDRAVRCLFTPPHFPAWDCALTVNGLPPDIPSSPTDSDVFDDEAKHFADSVEKETVKDQEPRLPQALQRMSTSSEILLAEDASGAKKKDTSYEASLRILNRNSLVNLAKCISRDEGHLLGVHLGMRPEKVGQIYRMYRHSSSLASFYVLYEWRGRRAQAEMADRLIEGLRDIERRDLANVIVGVRKQNRGLVSADFDSEGMANVRRVSYTHARR